MEKEILYREENGRQYWYYLDQDNEVRHRTDGPAYINTKAIGYQAKEAWYLHGERHNLTGSAIVCVNGDTYYYVFDKLHRYDGPACEEDRYKNYHLHGINF